MIMPLPTSILASYRQSPTIGEPVHVPDQYHDLVALILRTVIAVAEQDDTKAVVSEGESYELLCRKLESMSASVQELAEVASFIIEQRSALPDKRSKGRKRKIFQEVG
jgi:hypothetical protein